MGGLALDTRAWGFGGFSGLHLAPDLTLTAVSDLGHWWQARLSLDGSLAPLGLAGIRHGPLRDAAGAPLRGRRQRDAEALARLPDGSWLIGFEGHHRLQRHVRLDGPGQAFPAPPGLAAAPANEGIEALALLEDGRLLAIAEGLPGTGSGSRAAWLGERRGRRVDWRPRDYLPEPPLHPTGATGLPGGGALVVERGFGLLSGFRARVARLGAGALAGTAPLAGETLLRLPGDGPAENWEGIAAARHGDATLVALISDDNQRAAQRSLLLLYRLM